MNLRATILSEHSKAQTTKIVEWVGVSQTRFDELFRLFINDEYRVVQRAAWPLSYCVIQHPPLIKKHFGQLVANLQQPGVPGAVKRNSVRLLQHTSIPKKYQGGVMQLCFQYIASPIEAVAVKAFALTILQNLALIYPEIIPEVTLIIEERWPHETAAFHSRAKKFLKYSKAATQITL